MGATPTSTALLSSILLSYKNDNLSPNEDDDEQTNLDKFTKLKQELNKQIKLISSSLSSNIIDVSRIIDSSLGLKNINQINTLATFHNFILEIYTVFQKNDKDYNYDISAEDFIKKFKPYLYTEELKPIIDIIGNDEKNIDNFCLSIYNITQNKDIKLDIETNIDKIAKNKIGITNILDSNIKLNKIDQSNYISITSTYSLQLEQYFSSDIAQKLKEILGIYSPPTPEEKKKEVKYNDKFINTFMITTLCIIIIVIIILGLVLGIKHNNLNKKLKKMEI